MSSYTDEKATHGTSLQYQKPTFCMTIGSYEELCEIYGLTAKSIVEAVRTFGA